MQKYTSDCLSWQKEKAKFKGKIKKFVSELVHTVCVYVCWLNTQSLDQISVLKMGMRKLRNCHVIKSHRHPTSEGVYLYNTYKNKSFSVFKKSCSVHLILLNITL